MNKNEGAIENKSLLSTIEIEINTNRCTRCLLFLVCHFLCLILRVITRNLNYPSKLQQSRVYVPAPPIVLYSRNLFQTWHAEDFFIFYFSPFI